LSLRTFVPVNADYALGINTDLEIPSHVAIAGER